jgi:hypothetical protein
MEQQAGKRGKEAISEQEMTKQLQESGTQKEVGALSKDPSQLKDHGNFQSPAVTSS